MTRRAPTPSWILTILFAVGCTKSSIESGCDVTVLGDRAEDEVGEVGASPLEAIALVDGQSFDARFTPILPAVGDAFTTRLTFSATLLGTAHEEQVNGPLPGTIPEYCPVHTYLRVPAEISVGFDFGAIAIGEGTIVMSGATSDHLFFNVFRPALDDVPDWMQAQADEAISSSSGVPPAEIRLDSMFGPAPYDLGWNAPWGVLYLLSKNAEGGQKVTAFMDWALVPPAE